jgi:2-aminobenzoate-CoA ligase
LGEIHKAESSLNSVNAFIIVEDAHIEETIGGARYYTFNELVANNSGDLKAFRLKRDDIAILLYTSGTMGPPKGCAHTVAGVFIFSHLMTRYVWDLGEEDVLAGSAPISFAAGFGAFALVPFSSLGAISLLPKFSPESLMKNIARHRATVLTGIPTAYRKMLEIEDFDAYDLGSLKLCTVGGDSLGEKTFYAWLFKTGLPIWENYASTELFNAVISNRMAEKPRPGSIGLPLPGIEVKVVDDNLHPCPAGKIGALWVKSPTGIIYWNPRSQNGRLMKAQKLSIKDGWNIVGDAVYRDEEGYFYFAAREDDIIKSSGYRLSPGEIEDILGGHPMIREAAVKGVPDRIKGQIVKAFVVLKGKQPFRPDIEDVIKDYCREHMAIYKIPHLFRFVSQLPKTPTGKILKRNL